MFIIPQMDQWVNVVWVLWIWGLPGIANQCKATVPGLRRPVPNTGAPHPLLCEHWIRVYWDQHGSNSRIFGSLDQAKNDFPPAKLTHILCYISSFESSLFDQYSEILRISMGISGS